MDITNLDEFQTYCENDISLQWEGNDLLASGPLGSKLYKQIEPTTVMQQVVQSDEFYVNDYKPEYDLFLLKERIIGDLVQPVPEQPLGGHAVMSTKRYEWVDADEMYLINGSCVASVHDYFRLVRGSYAHRGSNTRHSFALEEAEAFCISAGGPCPSECSADAFTYSGKYVEREFWRWRDSAEGDGGEQYFLNVPLWHWTPSN